MSTPIQGWYSDPGGSGRLRWWDGAAWTDHVHDIPADGSPLAAPTQQDGAATQAGTATVSASAPVDQVGIGAAGFANPTPAVANPMGPTRAASPFGPSTSATGAMVGAAQKRALPVKWIVLCVLAWIGAFFFGISALATLAISAALPRTIDMKEQAVEDAQTRVEDAQSMLDDLEKQLEDLS